MKNQEQQTQSQKVQNVQGFIANPQVFLNEERETITHRVGVWINANQEAHKIYADIKSMLEKSPKSCAEEWAVHDYKGFSSISLSEWPDIERVSTLAKLIVTNGEPFSIWYENQCELHPQ